MMAKRNLASIKRPPIRWFGSKWQLAPWIVSHFPAHRHYVEPCFGAGNVLLRKKPVYLETANDLNGRVVNYFEVLRDRPYELLVQVQLTPWAYDEYQRCQAPAEDPLEDARRFHATCWMSIHGGPVHTGWRHQKDLHGRYVTPPDDLQGDSLLEVAKRLKRVQFTSLDARKMLKDYVGKEDLLIYFDPPYPRDTVNSHDAYGAWNTDEEFHRESAEILRSLSCYVAVSGRACDLYRDLYETFGWERLDKPARSNSGASGVDSLWLSPITAKALASEKRKQARLL